MKIDDVKKTSQQDLMDALVDHNCAGPCNCEQCKLIKIELEYRKIFYD